MPDVAVLTAARQSAPLECFCSETDYKFSGARNVWDTIYLDTNKAIVLHSVYLYTSVHGFTDNQTKIIFICVTL